MDRVVVIGCSGSGKSTLTRALAARTGLPVTHLDTLYWQPGWRVHPDPPAFHAAVRAIAEGPRWIIDGGFTTGNVEVRFARADTIVLFDLPPLLCLYRALKRYWTYRGETRPDLAPGCPETIDLAFYRYILTYRQDQLPRIEANIQRHFTGRLVRLTSDAETARFLAEA
jgi:adenylate kinase family enzyme